MCAPMSLYATDEAPVFLIPEKPILGPVSAIALHGRPKYRINFRHFDYVNPSAPKGGTITFGVLGSFDSFNPFVIKGDAAAGLIPIGSCAIHATLLESSKDEPFSKYGYAAETIEIAPDRSWVLFTLRRGVQFHDGSPMTADDVVFSFTHLRDKGAPFYKAYYRDVMGVVAVNNRQVRFELGPDSSPETPLILGELPILSKQYYGGGRFERADLKIPLGSGPYRIESFEGGRQVVYKRVPRWWGENLPVNVGRHNADTLKYIYFRDDNIMFEAFKSGAYDVRIESTVKNWALGYDFPDFKSGEVVRYDIPNKNPNATMDIFLNTRRDFFKDVRVRRAFIEAFDFEWMNTHLFYGLYGRSVTYFPPQGLHSAAVPTPEELYYLKPFRGKLPDEAFTSLPPVSVLKTAGDRRRALRRADAFLKDAGWIVQNGVRRHKETGAPLTCEIMATSTITQRALQNYQANLKRLGIDLSIRILDSAQYAARVDKHDYDLFFGTIPQSPSPGNEQRDFFESVRSDAPGGRNLSGIQNSIVDSLVASIIGAPTRTALEGATRALDRVLLWGFYKVPGYGMNTIRLAMRSFIKKPPGLPSYGIDFDVFWVHLKTIKRS